MGFSVAPTELNTLDGVDDETGTVEVLAVVSGDGDDNRRDGCVALVNLRNSRTKMIFRLSESRGESGLVFFCIAYFLRKLFLFCEAMILASSSFNSICFCCSCSSAVERLIL